jgi:hypothetical protein
MRLFRYSGKKADKPEGFREAVVAFVLADA